MAKIVSDLKRKAVEDGGCGGGGVGLGGVGWLVLWFNCRIYLQRFRNFYKRNIYKIIWIWICGCKARHFQLLLLFGIMTEQVETLTRLRGTKAVYLQNMKNLEWSIISELQGFRNRFFFFFLKIKKVDEKILVLLS